MARKSIPDTIKLRLWVKSAGRCEFKGCNKAVWQNSLTLSDGNFAEVAHIIGSSKDGPRGDDNSEELQVDYENLMLLCQACHKEIDSNIQKYPVDLLKRWKVEHEDRIEIQTSHPEDIHKSTVILCLVNIGERTASINFESLRNAMFPKYPVDTKGIKIEEINFDRKGDDSEWKRFAENKIKRKLEKALAEGMDDVKIKHLSLFGLAPMPLLFYFGKCVGDTIPCDIYQPHRNIEATNQTWNWPETSAYELSFSTTCLKKTTGKHVIINLAISDSLAEDKYRALLTNETSVYSISVTEPTPHFIRSKKQLEAFSYEYRKLLNTIQLTHGKDCEILILPAVPAAIAVECGRVILPNKDPRIFVAEYYGDVGEYRGVLQIN